MTNESSNMVMPVSPYFGGNGNNNNGFGGDWGWIILLLLCGWGGFGGGGFGGGFGNMMLGYDFPWLLNGQNAINANTNSGFQNAATNQAISSLQNSVTSGFGDVQNALCSGFGQAEISANARQMANMNQIFGLSQQFADCCCENRLANCQTQNVITREGAETRFADANNTRDIIQSQTSGTQAILDKLCQLELDQYKRENDALRSELSDARFKASQVAQTAEIQRGQVAEVDALYNRLATCPVGTMPVYGNQPIFTCSNNNGCGCGCGNNF